MLPLVKDAGAERCPKVKVMSKKCKGGKKNKKIITNKKDKKKKHKEEIQIKKKGKKSSLLFHIPCPNSPPYHVAGSCQFGVWSEWSPCRQNNQQRVRKVGLVTDSSS